jgi:hypothetical protein
MSADQVNVAALIPCYFEERHIRDVAARNLGQLTPYWLSTMVDRSNHHEARETALTYSP